MRILALTVLMLATSAPAFAASDCTSEPAALREASASAEPGKARKAAYLISVGEKLCQAGATQEANYKFAAAAKALGTQVAQAKSATPSAQ